MEEGCCKLSMQLSDYTQPIQCLPHYHDTVQKRLHLAFLNSQHCLNKICFFQTTVIELTPSQNQIKHIQSGTPIQ